MPFGGHQWHADRLKDGQGDSIPLAFDVKAAVVAPRAVWVTGEQVLGGQLAFHVVAPLVSLKVSVAGISQTKSGLGDMVVGPVPGYHYSPKLHSVAALDIGLPTGRYDKNDLANIGRNYWTIRPVYAMTYIEPTGFNGDFVAVYNKVEGNALWVKAVFPLCRRGASRASRFRTCGPLFNETHKTESATNGGRAIGPTPPFGGVDPGRCHLQELRCRRSIWVATCLIALKCLDPPLIELPQEILRSMKQHAQRRYKKIGVP
jgi:Putative MetA-pathway of phenol degradation